MSSSQSEDYSDSRSEYDSSDGEQQEYVQKKPHKNQGYTAQNFYDKEAADNSDSGNEGDEEEDIENDEDRSFINEDDDVGGDITDLFKSQKRQRNTERNLLKEQADRFTRHSNEYIQNDETEFIFDDSALNQPFASYRIALEPSTGSNQLFHVRCTPGKELLVLSHLYYKFFKATDQYNFLFAAYAPKMSSGYIYVEAKTLADANQICNGVPYIQKLTAMKNLKYSEMSKAMTLPRAEIDFHPGNFVEILRDSQKGYFLKGDIAQVINVNINRNRVMLKLVPRIDYDRIETEDDIPTKKTKINKDIRVPQADFNMDKLPGEMTDEVVQIGDQHVNFHVWNDEKFHGPFMYHEVEIKKLKKVDYIQADFGKKFLDNFYDFEQNIQYFKNNMYTALGLTNSTTFNTGDIARILPPHEYQDIIVDVISVQGNLIHVTPRPQNETEKAQFQGVEFDIQSDLLEKYFHEGDRVKIIAGNNRGKIGVVLGVDQQTFTAQVQLTSINQTVSERIANLAHTKREEEIQRVLGQYRLNDFVVLLDKRRGVIWRIEHNNAFILLDTDQSITADLSQIQCRAKDEPVRTSAGKTINKSSVVKVKDERSNAQVVHTTHSKVFLFSEQKQNFGGLFIRPPSDITVFTTPTNTAALSSSGGFVVARPKQDLSLKGKTIRILSGPQKGLLADVKEATSEDMHVVLQTTKKQIRLFRNRIKFTVIEKNNNFMNMIFNKDADIPLEQPAQKPTYDAPTYQTSTAPDQPKPYGSTPYQSVYSPQNASPTYGTGYGSPSAYPYNQASTYYGGPYDNSYGSPGSSTYSYGQPSPAAVPYQSPPAQQYQSPPAQPYGSPSTLGPSYGNMYYQQSNQQNSSQN